MILINAFTGAVNLGSVTRLHPILLAKDGMLPDPKLGCRELESIPKNNNVNNLCQSQSSNNQHVSHKIGRLASTRRYTFYRRYFRIGSVLALSILIDAYLTFGNLQM